MIMNAALHCGVQDVPETCMRPCRWAAVRSSPRAMRQSVLPGAGIYTTVTLTQLGEWHDARARWKRVWRSPDHRAALFRADLLAALAEAHMVLGDAGRALDLAEEAIQVALRNEMPIAEVLGQLALARALRSRESIEVEMGIEAALNRAQALVVSTGARSTNPRSASNMPGSRPCAARRIWPGSICAKPIGSFFIWAPKVMRCD